MSKLNTVPAFEYKLYIDDGEVDFTCTHCRKSTIYQLSDVGIYHKNLRPYSGTWLQFIGDALEHYRKTHGKECKIPNPHWKAYQEDEAIRDRVRVKPFKN